MQRQAMAIKDRLNLEGLRYAHAVAQTNSFSAAARMYGVTQPALSNGIAKLEQRLGKTLFDRSPRGVTQTAFGLEVLPLIARAVAAIDEVSAEARRWVEPPERTIRLGVSPLISSHLVARAFRLAAALPAPCTLVLREANMYDLRDELLGGQLVMIPAVAALPRFEHQIVDVEPVVVVTPNSDEDSPLELEAASQEHLILVPDTCGLTTFTTQLFQSHDLPLHAYPGQAASYHILEDWAQLGLGSALIPRSKLSGPLVPHRPLMDQGRAVQIAFEAVWSAGAPRGADLQRLADGLVAVHAK